MKTNSEPHASRRSENYFERDTQQNTVRVEQNSHSPRHQSRDFFRFLATRQVVLVASESHTSPFIVHLDSACANQFSQIPRVMSLSCGRFPKRWAFLVGVVLSQDRHGEWNDSCFDGSHHFSPPFHNFRKRSISTD